MVRTIPLDGPEELLDLTECFPDTNGPVSIEVAHKPEQTQRDLLNRNSQPITWGFRGEAKMEFEVGSTEQVFWLSTMVNRLASEQWACSLSLDGGVTWRDVVMAAFTGPKPLGGKVFAGAAYSLTVRTKELLAEIPPLGVGVW